MNRGRISLTMVAAAAAAAILAGCGLGPGPGTSDVSLTVTRDFGSRPLTTVTKAKVPGSETVIQMLERSLQVGTRYGGGFVESIDGLSGNSSRRDWFYYVNGIEAPVGAAQTAVHKGDRIWWDLHDWSATDSIPAVVGSFPEPFVHGIGGRRLPTVIECASELTATCNRIGSELHADGVPAASAGLAGGSGTDSLAILVGTWSELRGSFAAAVIDGGPAASGVYAKFAGTGSLELLNPHGQVARVLGPDAGLIAATSQSSAEPTWLVTGTDTAGVVAAAAALTQAKLKDHFALAVQGATGIPLPVQAAT